MGGRNSGLQAASIAFGSVNVGQSSAALPITLVFNSAYYLDNGATSVTLGSVVAVSQGAQGMDFAVASVGTCTPGAVLNSGTGCTATITFSPKLAGYRKGAVILKDNSGNAIATGFVNGTGVGPQMIFQPYTLNALGGGWLLPEGVGVDGAGNVFVAEYFSLKGSAYDVSGMTKEIPPGCTSASCVQVLQDYGASNTGFIFPNSITVDGAGNVLVASESSPVFSMACIPSAGALCEQWFVIPRASGVAVDGSGNLTISEAGATFYGSTQTVPSGLYEILYGWSGGTGSGALSTLAGTTAGYSFSLQTGGVAVDAAGNIFVADTGNSVVQEILANSNYSIAKTISGFNQPTYLTLDGFGNLFVTESGGAIKEVTAASGYTAINTVITMQNGNTFGTAVDGRGNLYIAGNSGVWELDYADPPALTFKTPTPPGNQDTTDGTQKVTIQNYGNAPLTISGIAISSADFSLDAGTTTCPTANPLAPGASCVVGVNFTPTIAGALTGALTVTDNALNAAGTTQQFVLSGTGLGAAAKTTPTVTVTPAPTSITTAQGVTVTVVVSGSPTPTGSVALASGSYSSLPAVLTGGSAAINIPAASLPVGTNTLTATYAPDTASYYTYNASAGSNSVVVSAATMQVTVGTSPAGLSFSVDGTTYTSSQTLTWTIGSNHTIATNSPQPSGSGTQQAFASWSDGGAMSHPVTASSSTTSYTATFNTQYQLTTAVSPASGGSVTPASGSYYTAGTVVNLMAAPNADYTFSNWTGNVANSSSASTTITMNAPQSVTANFSVAATVNLPPFNFGTVAVGSTTLPIPLTLTFSSNATLGGIVALTQGAPALDFATVSGGSCAVNTGYQAGDTCTVYVTFGPKFAGSRNGAIVLQDNSVNANTIGAGYVYGTGSGPQISFLPGSQSTLGGGFNDPNGVAVDGFGNVFVADVGNHAVKEIPVGCTSSGCVRTLGSGFVSPLNLALDGAGNLFVSDQGAGAVQEVLASGGYTTVNTLASGFITGLNGIAVDGSGNVFFAAGNHQVLELLAAGGYTTTIAVGSGYNKPIGVALDVSGNVFVADLGVGLKEVLAAGGYTTVNTLSGVSAGPWLAMDGNGNLFTDFGSGTLPYYSVSEMPAAGGYATSTTLYSGTSFSSLSGIAVDGRDNVYVAYEAGGASSSQIWKLDFADPPALTFPTPTVAGTTDTKDNPQQFIVQNNGNAPLTWSSIAASANFTVDSFSTTCSTSSALAAGSSCVVGVLFTPLTSGALTGTLTLTDNNLNAIGTTQQMTLSGVGLPPAPTIASGPANPTTATTATFAFTDTEAGVTFLCSLDSAAYAACSSADRLFVARCRRSQLCG